MRVIGWMVLVCMLFDGVQAVASERPSARTQAEETRMGQHPDLTRLVLDLAPRDLPGNVAMPKRKG